MPERQAKPMRPSPLFSWKLWLHFAGLGLALGWHRLEAQSEPYLRSVGPAPLLFFQPPPQSFVRPPYLQPLWSAPPTNQHSPQMQAAQTLNPETTPLAALNQNPHPEPPILQGETNMQQAALPPLPVSVSTTNAPPEFHAASEESLPGGAVTPQMLLPYFFTKPGAGSDSKTTIAMPFSFTPPRPPSRPPSKATYQSP